MATITYQELVKRVATERGTALGYTRDGGGLLSGPRRMDVHKSGNELIDGFTGVRIPDAALVPIEGGEMYPHATADSIPVIDLLGWPHTSAAEVAEGVLLALKD